VATVFQDEFEGTAGLYLHQRMPEVGEWGNAFSPDNLALSGDGFAQQYYGESFGVASLSEPFALTGSEVSGEIDVPFNFQVGVEQSTLVIWEVFDEADSETCGFRLRVSAGSFSFNGYLPFIAFELTTFGPGDGTVVVSDGSATSELTGSTIFAFVATGNEIVMTQNGETIFEITSGSPIFPAQNYVTSLTIPDNRPDTRIAHVQIVAAGEEVPDAPIDFWSNLIGTEQN
jgi:hypothetical protein